MNQQEEKQEQILVGIAGQDRPGVTASVTEILARYDAQWAHPIRQHGSSSYAKNRGKVARAKQKAAKAKGGNGLLKKGLGILKGLM